MINSTPTPLDSTLPKQLYTHEKELLSEIKGKQQSSL